MNPTVTMNGTNTQTAHQETLKKTACYILNITTTNGIWQGENPLIETLPQFVKQLLAIIVITRTLYLFLKPFRIPPIVSDIFGGMLLGPFLFGKTYWFIELFPLRSVMAIETLSYLALVFYMFLLGLRMEIRSILRSSKKAITIAAAGIFISMAVGIGLYSLTKGIVDDKGRKRPASGCFFWGIALSITGFPVVVKILSDLNLLHTEIGRMAMSVAIVTEFCVWVLISIVVPIVVSPYNAAYVVTSTVAFILISIFAVRPLLARIIHRTSKRNNGYSEFYLCFILVGVLLCSFVTDVCGAHSIVGAFIFGLIWPDKKLGAVIIERFEDFVTGLMLPAFFAISGIRISVEGVKHWEVVIVILILACAVKILSTFLVCYFCKMTVQEGLALGVIMNTKGILVLVVLNQGFDKQFLLREEYAVMVIAILIMTTMVAPIIGRVYRPEKSLYQYKLRTIQRAKPDAKLRILTCIYSTREVAGMINLIDVTNTTKQSPICLLVLHLVELKGRASAALIAHNIRNTSGSTHRSGVNSESEEIIHALEMYENHTGITIQPLTALSLFVTMDKDVCNLAEDKHISFIILPFHKETTSDGDKEEGNAAFHSVNQNILVNAPCSVGIFVDRGFSAASQGDSSNNNVKNIMMIFIGGPDDREALALAWRMAGNPAVHYLTVIRLLPDDDVDEVKMIDNTSNTQGLLATTSHNDQQRRHDDDEYVNKFRIRTASDQHVTYSEKLVNNGDETVAAIRGMSHNFDLYIVGRGEGMVSPLMAGSLDWSDCQELGPIGDLLVSSNVAYGSVLVVQQYVGSVNAVAIDMLSTPDRSSNGAGKFGGSLKMPAGDSEGCELFTRQSKRDDDDEDDQR